MTDDIFSLEGRVLCSDDTCIGLVGADGRCKTCGAIYTGTEPLLTSESGAIPVVTTSVEDHPLEAVAPPNDDTSDTKEGVGDRICCPDDTCIGIIGEDGKCGTCGKSA